MRPRGRTDAFTLRQILHYARLVQPRANDVWLDGGMNIGAFSEWVVQHGARVVGYEPEPENFALAQRRLAHLPGVTLVEAALVPDRGARFRPLYLHRKVDSHSLIAPRSWPAVPAIPVETVVFDDALREHHITAIKLDVEGLECELLNTVTDWAPIHTVLFEYHGMKDDGLGYEAVTTLLREKFPIVRIPPRGPHRFTFNVMARR